MDDEHTGEGTVRRGAEGPPVCFVLLGASNLARGYGALSHFLAHQCAPRPVRFLAALGPGRGYCVPGGILNLTYPPIRTSPIFRAAEKCRKEGAEVVALVTDIGNDILYGVPAEEIIAAVQEIFDRLSQLESKIYVTLLPPVFEKNLPPWVFLALRTILYPRSRITMDEVRGAMQAVNRYLENLEDSNIRRIEGVSRYMGWDEIHYGWVAARHAWTLLGAAMVSGLGVRPRGRVGLSSLICSYLEMTSRLVWDDLFKFRKRNPEFF